MAPNRGLLTPSSLTWLLADQNAHFGGANCQLKAGPKGQALLRARKCTRVARR